MAIRIHQVGPQDKKLHAQFIQFAHTLYSGCTQWVPFFNIDMRKYLTRKHPYFLNYPAEFFIAKRGVEVVGTIEVSYNHNFINMHKINAAHFFFMDFIEELEVSKMLIEAAAEWARQQGATQLIGPYLSGGALGSGILIDGYEHAATMTMMRYNYPYYQTYLEQLGFCKLTDLYSYHLDPLSYKNPEKVTRVTEIVKKRSNIKLKVYRSRIFLLLAARKMLTSFYNSLLGDHIENYPMENNELNQLLKDLILVTNPKFIKFLRHQKELIGYLLAFPDVTAEIQRCRGSINPISIIRLIYTVHTTRRVTFNGIGVLPEYQNKGGNALLFTSLSDDNSKKPGTTRFNFIELTQIAEPTSKMLTEISYFKKTRIKTHRIMQKDI